MLKSKLLVIALVFALVLSAFIGTGQADAAKGNVSVSLSTATGAFGAGDALVSVTFKNEGKTPAKILKWYTPYDDVEESLFAITRDGSPVAYIGAMYKRAAPTAGDYVTLRSGESFTRTVDLRAYYDLSVSGGYSIQYHVSAWNLRSEKATLLKRDDTLSSNQLGMSLEGRATDLSGRTITPDVVTGSTSFTTCTTTQQSSLITARSQASTYAANASAYLNAGTQGSRYTTWFGVYNLTRYNTVKSNFTAILSAMDTQSVTFNCKCKKTNTYAYVYANQPYTIYLCGAFWAAPMTGTDSKGGTLIHEMSHFTVVAGTNDYAYGQTNAKNLALSNPTNAVANADNHEYFAENTPALP